MKPALERKANGIFYQLMGAGAIFFTALIFLGIKIYPQIMAVKQSLTKKIETVCGCANYFDFNVHPLRAAVPLIIGLALAAFFLFFALQIYRLKRATSKFIRQNVKKAGAAPSFKLAKAAGLLGLAGRVSEAADNNPLVFCHGFYRPKICVSSQLAERLTETELMAVLSHEKRHLLSREPLRALLVKLLAKSLFFAPWFASLAQKYFTYAELAADEYAALNLRHKAPLAQALLKIIQWERQIIIRDYLTLSFFETVTEERINKLADDRYLPRFRIFTPRSLIGSLIIGAAIFVFYNFFDAPPIVASGGRLASSCELPPVYAITVHGENCVLRSISADEQKQSDYSSVIKAEPKDFGSLVDN
ncbi:M56 family metallopeptidase [Candidatus Uhrbacteria bacterium]|nr:M56 family metallopeptidase [Candidatus Uhrbacteria bacterium]